MPRKYLNDEHKRKVLREEKAAQRKKARDALIEKGLYVPVGKHAKRGRRGPTKHRKPRFELIPVVRVPLDSHDVAAHIAAFEAARGRVEILPSLIGTKPNTRACNVDGGLRYA